MSASALYSLYAWLFIQLASAATGIGEPM